MVRIFFIILLCLATDGCDVNKGKPAIRIGSICISAREFDEAFNASAFAYGDKEQKREFLETFISRKLMLKEAEKMGLDKEKSFLGDIQLFWEQSLLKSMISIKTKEFSLGVNVSDKEIKDYYEAHKDSFGEKELSRVSDHIKWIILKEKEHIAMNEWAESLKDKTKIKIDYELLGIEQQ